MNGDLSTKKLNASAIFNLSPNFYAFMGGLFISAAVNLYTGVFAADQLPNRWKIILLSSLLAFLSGIAWSVLAWNLETINRLA